MTSTFLLGSVALIFSILQVSAYDESRFNYTSSNWPGENKVVTVDQQDAFTENLSGLKYHASGSDVMYAVMNKPSKLFKLVWDGKYWSNYQSSGWGNGKTIYYTNGKGSPDSEDVTMDDTGSLFVCTERDNDQGSSKLSILRYVDSGSSSTLTATNEWILTSDLPAVDSNQGLEAITWIPDTFLVAKGFHDQKTGALYNPSSYPSHGNGLFFVGLEGNGYVYAYALDSSSNKFTRIASFSSGEVSVMALAFDPDSGYLWSICDNTCNGRSNVFTINNGAFNKIATFNRPSSMGDFNNEGFTVASDSECDANGFKDCFWADDANDQSHAIRRDSIPCGQFI